MLPVVKSAVLAFDKYPGSIPVVGGSAGTPAIFPTDVESNSTGATVVGYCINVEVVDKSNDT